MSDDVKLKPCPFCGGNDIVLDRDCPESPAHTVFCWNCGAIMEAGTDHTIDASPFDRWNTRPALSTRNEALDDRAQIVAWLHRTAANGWGAEAANDIAGAIERGEHLKGSDQ